MPQFTPNYNLLIPGVTDNVNASTLPGIGNSNTIIDTTMKSLSDTDASLQLQIDTNYTVLDTKIDNQVDILNNRITNLVLNSAPLPAVAAQEVADARFSPVYNITYTVLTDRITHAEQEIIDTQVDLANVTIVVQDFIENYAAIIRLGGLA